MSQLTDVSSPARVWKLATALLAISTIVLAGWSELESDRVNSLERSLQQAQQQLLTTHDQLMQATKPDLPVSLGFRPALLGSGLVGVFKNTSSSSLEVAAIFSSPATGSRQEANLVIPPNGVKEIGHAEGWPFAPGQHIKLTNNRYRTAEYEVPGT